MSKYIFYAATFGDAFSIAELDTDTQQLTHLRSINQPRPAQLALSKDQTKLYVTSEMYGEPGQVDAYDIRNPLYPVLLSRVFPENSQGPCYIAISENGRYCVGCSYFEGNVEVFPILENGALGERCFEHRFTATGTAYLAGSYGQAVPRSHGVITLPGTDFILVTDYSGDRVVCFRLEENGSLTEVSSVQFPAGDAPRHLVCNPVYGNIFYMITEYTSMVYSIKIDMESGGMQMLMGLHTLKDAKASFSSGIKISADGKFLYVPNRHQRNISVLKLLENGEVIDHVGVLPNAGFVRDIQPDPTGEFLLAGDQDENKIMLYKVNKESGMCALLASELKVPTPAFFAFIEKPFKPW